MVVLSSTVTSVGVITNITSENFKEKLHYNNTSLTNNVDNPQWGGNIANMEWQAKGLNSDWNVYMFTYNALGWLTEGWYKRKAENAANYGSGYTTANLHPDLVQLHEPERKIIPRFDEENRIRVRLEFKIQKSRFK